MRDGWIETTLGDVAEWWSGGTPKAREPKYYENGTIPWAVIADMNKGIINSTNSNITENALDLIGGRLAPVGSVLISMYASVGKSAIANIPLATNQAIAWSIPNQEKIIPFYLYLVSQQLEKEISGLARGATQRNINRQMLREFTFQLPPLPEQKRIVDLISSVDSYIEALQQQLMSAKKSRNAVLHELMTAGGDDWETTTIGDISDFVSVRNSPEQLSADSIYVGLEHLEPNNTSIDNFDSVSKVTSSLTPFDVGDVLFGRLRPYLHKVAIAEMFGFCSPEILVLRANSKVLPQMLLLFCDADSTINICVERSAGTRMPRTSTEDLASIEIKLPPIVEQIKLAELSSTFDTDISHLGITLEKSRILRSGLLSDLLSGTHEIPPSYDKVIGAA